MANDAIGRKIAGEDFVFYYNSVYKVLATNDTMVKVMIHPKSKTSRARHLLGREVALLPKEDVLLWLIKNGGEL